MRRLIPVLLLAVLSACAANGGGKRPAPALSTGQFAKSDVDRVSEAALREQYFILQNLAEKLYKRNPKEWKKGGFARPEDAIQRLFATRHNWQFNELNGRYGTDAVLMALKPEFEGDRVFAVIAGLGGMVLTAFDGRYESYMFDDIDPQRISNAARNVEIAVWKLSNARGADGALLLLSNEMGTPPNLSFEREFGKMIGTLDLLSTIIAEKSNRTVVKVVQSMATAVFLPVAAIK